MDDALRAAADLVEERLNKRLRESRKTLQIGSPRETIRQAFKVSIDAMVKEAELTRLFLRHRRDPSTPLGRRFQQMYERSREDLLRDLKMIGMTDEMVQNLQVHAHLITGMTLTVAEGLLDKTLSDPEACYDGITRMALGATEGWSAD